LDFEIAPEGTVMLNLLFPAQIDNRFRGQIAGIWVFGVLVALKLAIGFNSIFMGRQVAQGADGIPLDKFTPEAANEIVSIFALLGLLHVTMALLCVIALVRYRAMIPLLLALLLIERFARYAIVHFLPGVPPVQSAPGSIMGLILPALMIGGLLLSLWTRKTVGAE